MDQNQSASPPKYRPSIFKRQYLIFPRVQFSVISRFFGINLLGLIVMHLVTQWGFENYLIEIKPHIKSDPVVFDQIRQGLVTQLEIVAVSVILAMFVLNYSLGVLITHKLVGPIYRLKSQFAKKDLTRAIKFRVGDYFHDVAQTVNEYFGLK